MIQKEWILKICLDEVLLYIISNPEISKVKYQITLLIKYIIENHKTYKKDLQLQQVVDGINDSKTYSFFGLFSLFIS